MAYKKDQGRYARLAAFWTLAFLIFYGCTSLHTDTLAKVRALHEPLVPSMPTIPVLGLSFNLSLFITTVVLAAALYALYRWLETPKVADLLIETEAELRKVTWPTMPEAVNSSAVVMACVLFLMVYLAVADLLLGEWAKRILLGGKG